MTHDFHAQAQGALHRPICGHDVGDSAVWMEGQSEGMRAEMESRPGVTVGAVG